MRHTSSNIFALLTFFTIARGLPNNFGNRIVGGSLAQIEDFPYQVSFYYDNRFSCGASILTKNVVITAAHCTDSRSVEIMYIRAGTSYQGIDETSGRFIKVVKVVQHPKYNVNLTDYDVSLLLLGENLNFYFKIQPIELSPASEKEYAGKTGLVTGWGLIREGEEEAAQQLRQLRVPLHDWKFCFDIYGDELTENMICAGDIGGGHDTCMGDSGGPLAFEGKLIGIVSWGYGCAQSGRPGLYTNVLQLTPWIVDEMSNLVE